MTIQTIQGIFMKLAPAWLTRITGPTRVEVEQAIVRVAIFTIVTPVVLASIGVSPSPWSEAGHLTVALMMAGLLCSIIIFASIWIWPNSGTYRRIFGMFLDVAAITLAIVAFDRAGTVLLGMYIWLILGYGIRYGRRYFYACQFLSLAGFVVAVSKVPWWRDNLDAFTGWAIAIVTIPVYVYHLAEQLNKARVSAETKLSECLERERGPNSAA
jgi:two-component system sensor histidine kinase RpfC